MPCLWEMNIKNILKRNKTVTIHICVFYFVNWMQNKLIIFALSQDGKHQSQPPSIAEWNHKLSPEQGWNAGYMHCITTKPERLSCDTYPCICSFVIINIHIFVIINIHIILNHQWMFIYIYRLFHYIYIYIKKQSILIFLTFSTLGQPTVSQLKNNDLQTKNFLCTQLLASLLKYSQEPVWETTSNRVLSTSTKGVL